MQRVFFRMLSSINSTCHRGKLFSLEMIQALRFWQEDLEKYGDDQLIADALKSGGAELRQYARRIEADLRKVQLIRKHASVCQYA